MSVRIVAPQVVKPLIASKNGSTTPSSMSASGSEQNIDHPANGIAEMIAPITHADTTNRHASRRPISRIAPRNHIMPIPPNRAAIPDAVRNAQSAASSASSPFAHKTPATPA